MESVQVMAGIEDHVALRMACGTSRDLRQRPHVAQEALLVGVEDRHQRHRGQVEAFAQQVHAHQHVEHSGPQVFRIWMRSSVSTSEWM